MTAANASSLNDGAAAVVVMSASRAEELGVTPLAKIRGAWHAAAIQTRVPPRVRCCRCAHDFGCTGFADAAHAPIEFTTAPSLAVPKALSMAGVQASDCDFHEVNEAFATVVLANMKVRARYALCRCLAAY